MSWLTREVLLVIGFFAFVAIGTFLSSLWEKKHPQEKKEPGDRDRILSFGSGDGTMEASCDDCECLGCDATFGHGPRCS